MNSCVNKWNDISSFANHTSYEEKWLYISLKCYNRTKDQAVTYMIQLSWNDTITVFADHDILFHCDIL